MPKIDLDKLSKSLSSIKFPILSKKHKKILMTSIVALPALASLLLKPKNSVKSLPNLNTLLGLSVVTPHLIATSIATFLMTTKWYNKDNKSDLLCTNKTKVRKLTNATIQRLKSQGIAVSADYDDLLYKMAQVMIHDKPINFPTVLTTRPGLGKTEMLIATLALRLQNETDFTAIVVTRFIKEAKRIADEVNAITGIDDCFVRPSFQYMTMNNTKCPAGYLSKDYKIGICFKCSEKGCPAKKQHYSFQSERVVLISSVYFQNCI